MSLFACSGHFKAQAFILAIRLSVVYFIFYFGCTRGGLISGGELPIEHVEKTQLYCVFTDCFPKNRWGPDVPENVWVCGCRSLCFNRWFYEHPRKADTLAALGVPMGQAAAEGMVVAAEVAGGVRESVDEGKEDKQFECGECRKRFKRKGYLTQHVKDIHSLETPFECDTCGAKFKRKSALKTHNERVHLGLRQSQAEKDAMKVQCDICQTALSCKSALATHVKMRHLGRTFDCKQCSKRLKSKSLLRHHVQVVHEGKSNKREKRFACEQCTGVFTARQGLSVHITAVHNQEKNFVCDQCESAFSQQAGLNTHISRVHLGERPYRCHLCPAAFGGSSHLKNHITAIHDMLLSWKCKECDFVSATKGNLTHHVRQVHRNLRPNRCTQCEFSSYAKYNLDIHVIAMHDRIRRFACQQCELAFFRLRNLRSHIHDVHDGLPRIPCQGQYCALLPVGVARGVASKGDICSDCAPGAILKRKTKEAKIAKFLGTKGVIFAREVRVPFCETSGQRLRPAPDAPGSARLDFYIELDTHRVILEVDEQQHWEDSRNRFNYTVSCEQRRVMEIKKSVAQAGNSRKTKFIRFNPDAYRRGEQLLKLSFETRMQVLEDCIREPPTTEFSVEYLFYDEEDEDNEDLVIFSHEDFCPDFLKLCKNATPRDLRPSRGQKRKREEGPVETE